MQILLNGVIDGAAIALLAVAFQSVYLPTRVFFWGLAGIYGLAPYVMRTVAGAGVPWPAAVFTTVLSCVLLAALCETLNHGPLARRSASESAHLIASLGITIVLVQIIAIVWGNDTKTLRISVDSTTHIGGMIITGSQWITAGVSVGLLAIFGAVLMSTDIGLRLRGLSDNPTMFALFGYNVSRHRVLAFMISGLFATAASLVTAYDLGFDPHGGLAAVLLAVVAVIIGGRFSFFGPMVGALIIGVLRAEVVWYYSARWEEAATFALLAVFLLLRPQGLLGRKTRLEATTS